MSTTAIINYPIEGTVLFSDTLTIHYKLSSNTDPNIGGIYFVLDTDNEYTDTDLTGTYTITGLTEDLHTLTGYLINRKNKKIAGTDFSVTFNTYDSTLEVEDKLTYVLKSTIPNFVKEDFPNFVAFLKAYYEWLYSSNNPFYAPLISEDFKDIDKTPEYFVKYFREQYLRDFPEYLTLDKQTGTPLNLKTLIKNIKDFYSSKGTEKSIKFLLTILFDTYSEIYYPKKDIFKASESKWRQNNCIKFAYSSSNIHDIKNKRMYQETGETVSYIANIDQIQVYRSNDNKQIVEVFYSHEEGTKSFLKSFKVDLESEIVTLTPMLSANGLEIEDGGLNYKVNDKITIVRNSLSDTNDEDKIISIARVAEVDMYGTITKIEFSNFGVTYTPKLHLTSGIIEDNEDFVYTAIIESDNGSDAILNVELGYVCSYAGYWTNKNSHPDTIKKIPDNKRYQEFSYVVRTDRSLDRYVDALKKLAHPAGMEVLGDVVVQNTLLEPAIISDAFANYFTPLIGNYAAFRVNTSLDIRNGDTDLFPNGFDPTAPIPPQDGTTNDFVHEISTNGALDDLVIDTSFKYVPSVSDAESINDYWVVYTHPNTEINTYTDTSSFMDIVIKDFVKQEK